MSRVIRKTAMAVAMMVLLSGCLYTDIRVPLDENVEETQLGSKVGRATWKSFLGLFAFGDASTAAAAHQGSITTIKHLDAEQKIVFFGLYTESTTIAYGD